MIETLERTEIFDSLAAEQAASPEFDQQTFDALVETLEALPTTHPEIVDELDRDWLKTYGGHDAAHRMWQQV